MLSQVIVAGCIQHSFPLDVNLPRLLEAPPPQPQLQMQQLKSHSKQSTHVGPPEEPAVKRRRSSTSPSLQLAAGPSSDPQTVAAVSVGDDGNLLLEYPAGSKVSPLFAEKLTTSTQKKNMTTAAFTTGGRRSEADPKKDDRDDDDFDWQM